MRHDSEGLIPIIRVRNPWGDGAEWTGDWSDGLVLFYLVLLHFKSTYPALIFNENSFYIL